MHVSSQLFVQWSHTGDLKLAMVEDTCFLNIYPTSLCWNTMMNTPKTQSQCQETIESSGDCSKLFWRDTHYLGPSLDIQVKKPIFVSCLIPPSKFRFFWIILLKFSHFLLKYHTIHTKHACSPLVGQLFVTSTLKQLSPRHLLTFILKKVTCPPYVYINFVLAY